MNYINVTCCVFKAIFADCAPNSKILSRDMKLTKTNTKKNNNTHNLDARFNQNIMFLVLIQFEHIFFGSLKGTNYKFHFRNKNEMNKTKYGDAAKAEKKIT